MGQKAIDMKPMNNDFIIKNLKIILKNIHNNPAKDLAAG